ncbi:unnamed protein product [Victoria cruziana]
MIRMNGGGYPQQACAACKHQRRKCTPDCPLAPFFPAEKTSIFLAVQKVFGVSNVVKMIRELDTYEKRRLAVDSLCWEAQWRIMDPVEGCFGEVKRLKAELRAIKNILGPQDRSIKDPGGIGKPENSNPFVYSNSSIDNNVANGFGVVLTASNANNNCVNNGGLANVRGSSHLYGFNKGNCDGGQLLYQLPAMEGADRQLLFRGFPSRRISLYTKENQLIYIRRNKRRRV